MLKSGHKLRDPTLEGIRIDLLSLGEDEEPEKKNDLLGRACEFIRPDLADYDIHDSYYPFLLIVLQRDQAMQAAFLTRLGG